MQQHTVNNVQHQTTRPDEMTPGSVAVPLSTARVEIWLDYLESIRSLCNSPLRPGGDSAQRPRFSNRKGRDPAQSTLHPGYNEALSPGSPPPCAERLAAT